MTTSIEHRQFHTGQAFGFDDSIINNSNNNSRPSLSRSRNRQQQYQEPVVNIVTKNSSRAATAAANNRFGGVGVGVGSTRSIASSITFTDFGTDLDIEENCMFDPFVDASYSNDQNNATLDHKPGMPQRRQSASLASINNNNNNEEEEYQQEQQQEPTVRGRVGDIPPARPIRQASVGSSFVAKMSHQYPNIDDRFSDTTTTTHQTIISKIASNKPPTRPTRKQSLANTIVSSYYNVEEEFVVVAAANNDNNNEDNAGSSLSSSLSTLPRMVKNDGAPAALRSSSTSTANATAADANTTSSMEPIPQYLHPAFATEIQSKMKELKEKANIFKSIVSIKDRKYGIRTFKQCFVGSEAIDKMIQVGLVITRCEAVDLGRAFMKYLGLMEHVCHDHTFKDKYLFYRFCSCGADDNTAESVGHHHHHHHHTNNYKSSLVAAAVAAAKRGGMKSRHMPWYSLQHRETIAEEEDERMDEDSDNSTSILAH